jgi:hypothetical protein
MMRRLLFASVLLGLLLSASLPAFASNVCPVVGGPDNAEIKSTPAEVPDKSTNPAHGTQDSNGTPVNPQPSDVFWN